MKKLAAITAAVVLIGALAFLFLKVRRFSDHEHEQFQTALWRLKHLDTAFKEGVLEARFALVDNYDDFQTQETELTRLVEGLNQTPTFIQPADRLAIGHARGQYAVLSQERKKLFDRFKSQNAMLANSRRYLPGALDELAARLQAGGTNRELQEIVGGITRLTLMRLSSPDELPADAPARLQQLKQWAVSRPEHAESMFALSILRHAQNIVAGNGELDALTRQLLALPTEAAIETLFQTYKGQVTKALHQAQQYRTFLYVLGFVVLIGIAYTLWTLRSANRNLERRVEWRTRELAGSEERFRTLCVASPIGIYMADAEGRCAYTNPSLEATLCLTREQCLGDGWTSVLHSDDRELVLGDWLAATRNGQRFAREFRLQPPGQEMRWVYSQAAMIRSESGEVTGQVGTVENITERKRAEAELARTQNELLEISRMAGMAEVATSVLHNVGNVLNSVNVSSALVADSLKKSKVASLAKVVDLLRERTADLGDFLTQDPKGKQLPAYLAQLADHLAGGQAAALAELALLRQNIEHINDIVAMQQSFAKVSGVMETLAASELVEEALKMSSRSQVRHQIEIVREFGRVPPFSGEKHKVLQILVNLMRNARQACDELDPPQKRLTFRVTNGNDRVRIGVIDNGIGILSENLTRIFAHGFTTKESGHGFGLHSGALAAREMGGSLTAHSDGPGQGATFTLELPVTPPNGRCERSDGEEVPGAGQNISPAQPSSGEKI